MSYRSRLCAVAFASCCLLAAVPAQAQLFWRTPDFKGAPVTGNEPGVVIPLPGATPDEMTANVVWTMRAGLNVAALQCNFAPSLMTRENYNALIVHHAKELGADYKLLGAYFQRVKPKGESVTAAQTEFDRYVTQVYNSFSTLKAQYGFCQTASRIGVSALLEPKGSFVVIARTRLRELRNSLVPMGDNLWAAVPPPEIAHQEVPGFPPECFDHKGQLKKKCLK